MVETETSSCWHDSPEIEREEMSPAAIGTEIFFFPAAGHAEKDGTFTNTQRLLQWHHKAVEPPGDARSDLWFMFHLGRLVRERLQGSTRPYDRGILNLAWDYPVHGPHAEPSADAVLQERGGRGPDRPAPSSPGWRPSGAGPGRRTGACSTTAPPPTRPASRGRSARRTSGGTPTRGSGRATTCPTSPRPRRRTTSRPRARAATTR